MEAELLRGMIADREERIAKIERKTSDGDKKIHRVQQQLEEVKQQNADLAVDLKANRERLMNSKAVTIEKLSAAQADMNKQGRMLQAYAGALKQEDEIVSASNDANFVTKMQAQLCKAMHTLGIIDHQLEIVKEQAADMTKLQKDAMTSVSNEMSEIELELMNQLMERDTATRAVENDFSGKLAGIRREMDAVEEQVFSSDDEDEEESDEEEIDEEEKAAKEELMRMLQQQKEKISNLERETEEQEDTIQELEDQLEELRGNISSSERQRQRAAELRAQEEKEAEKKAAYEAVEDLPDDINEIQKLIASRGTINDPSEAEESASDIDTSHDYSENTEVDENEDDPLVSEVVGAPLQEDKAELADQGQLGSQDEVSTAELKSSSHEQNVAQPVTSDESESVSYTEQ